MTRPGRYPQELRERAVRLVFRGILAAFGTTITQARLAYPEQAVLVMGCNSVSRAPGTARSTMRRAGQFVGFLSEDSSALLASRC